MNGFLLDDTLTDLRTRVRTFVDDNVIPQEAVIERENAEGRRDTLTAIQERVKSIGLWTPHLPEEHGGLGLGVMGMCALFREMGRSPFGAKAFNCDAPDQGNMDLLIKAASAEIKDDICSPAMCGSSNQRLCMTEPAPRGRGPSESPYDSSQRWSRMGPRWP